MRHINRKREGFDQFQHRGEPRMEPYIELSFKPFKTRSNKNRACAKILQFIANNPYCRRREVLIGIGAVNAYDDRHRGQHSTVFANLLHQDLIDYDKQFKYFITSKGIDKMLDFGFRQLWA